MENQDCGTLLQPLAQSQITKKNLLPSINYTNQDFFSMKTRLIAFIQEQFPNDFNDFVESDLGIMLIENMAFLADTLSFKQDQIVNEIFIDSVTEVENAFRLARLVGFKPTPPIASRAMISASINSSLPVDLVIQSGLQLTIGSGGASLVFELFQADSLNNPVFDIPITISAGNLLNTSIIAVEGITREEIFSGDGSISQTLSLSFNPVIFDSIRVDIDGTRWTQVDYFTDSQLRNEYRVEFDSNWNGFVIFGNGLAGRLPGVGSEVRVTYRTGGGIRGNIITGSINEQRGVQVPGFAFAVPVTFRNYTKGDFGYNGDVADDVRRKLPAFTATQDRAVTGLDYKTLTDLFATAYNGQVGKSTAVLRNYGCAGNVVDLYILARSEVNALQTASDELKVELLDYINEKKMLTDSVCIKDGVVLLVDILIDVQIDKFYRKFKEEIETKILNRISDFFALSNWEYGQLLKEADLLKAVSDIKEPTGYTISFVTNDPDNSGSIVVARYYEIIRNDNTSITLTFE